jgi:hypothetical protein
MQVDERRAQLREQLADPKQREALVKERLLSQRVSNPDLGRVLRIDADTQAKLLALLVDQALANELRDGPFTGNYGSSAMDGMQQAAENYNQQIGEITKLLGPLRLDAYLDYDRTRAARNRVEDFASSLADSQRLTGEQKDALVAGFAEDEARQLRGSRLGLGIGRVLGQMPRGQPSPDDLKQRSLMLQIYLNEQTIRQRAITDRDTLARLPQVLSPEQTRAYGAQQARQLAELRTRTDALRRDAGVGPNELLPPEDVAPLNTNLRLQVNVNINGQAVSSAGTTRGAPVSFAGPDGLWVEAEPSLLDADNLSVELRFYESAQGGRRLVGSTLVRPNITNARPATVVGPSGFGSFSSFNGTFSSFNGFSSLKAVLRGRKAYLLDLGVTATYL